MADVKRVYIEKKPEYAIEAKGLLHEIRGYLGLKNVCYVRVLYRYDVEGLSDETFEKALRTVFSEPPLDTVFRDVVDVPADARVFSVEYLPGQFDQRADSAVQSIRLLEETAHPLIRYATTYIVGGSVSDEELAAVQSLVINPVDSRIAEEALPDTLEQVFPEPEDVESFTGFRTMPDAEFRKLYDSLGLAMTYADLCFIRDHFRDEVRRDPTVTEIRVLDTYWSDHCRHTTFLTELKEVVFDDGAYRARMEETFRDYLASRDRLYAGRSDKFVCLMDLALAAAKRLKAEGKLTDQEESDEINACSIIIPVDVNGVEEEWLLNFKNETHNHPTEIEPFGGAATCLGGAIRDPLSGRTYVYQAMRVTGAGDPTRPMKETLHGKLPQKKLVREAAHGYSSYGNQIGLATGYVKEFYHPGYVAKRMEIGAVLGAAPRRAVRREDARPGDIIVLLGGETGRDGIGGATGSSKVHTEASIEVCGAEVQKGNAPTERKLQRLFRREEVSRLIRKCNDFGAGGVSVAIGELADGLMIDLDKVPKKYAGLDGTEIAISESQERMAVVVAPEDCEEFCRYASEENLESTVVAVVTEEPYLTMTWRGKTIVRLSRAFMNTNGAHQETSIAVDMPDAGGSPFRDGVVFAKDGWKEADSVSDPKEMLLSVLSDLNVCSQRGLVEMFDSSIGAGSVLMPYGGVRQFTETQTMVAKIPVEKGETKTVSMMSCGFDPYLSSWSPFHGAAWAVTESIAKIVSAGGDMHKIRFTFQEYFRRMTSDPYRWSQPFSALLGAYAAQIGYGLPSIGGKDSMSGTFEKIDVAPTLVSFAVDTARYPEVITPELKKENDRILFIGAAADSDGMPDFSTIASAYTSLHEDMLNGRIRAAYVTGRSGIAAACAKMGFGSGLGVSFDKTISAGTLFAPAFAGILIEVSPEDVSRLTVKAEEIGSVASDGSITIEGVRTEAGEMMRAYTSTLEPVFHTTAGGTKEEVSMPYCRATGRQHAQTAIAKPRVFIPVFPGTNCEYDLTKAFERAGAAVSARVFRNLSAEDIRSSADEFVREIRNAQIIMFPGGFSAGDEPEGSAKFFAAAFRNAKIAEAVEELLKQRDGLILGICNGFQALIKLGLVPYGDIRMQDEDSPTLTFNTIGRHVSRMVYTKVVSNRSPWLANTQPGEVYVTPASHGEGRFVASPEWIRHLSDNGQIATQYCDPEGNVTMDDLYNINGSFAAIEGITSPDGRIFGKMAHIERRGGGIALNIVGEQDMRVFEAGVSYFR